MKTAFIITSCIEVKNEHPLTYSKTRSYFSSEERLRQTITTIASIDSLVKKDATIYIVDASEHWENYANYFWYQPNLKFISIKNEFPEIFNTVTSHPNKSYCECLLLEAFMSKYREELVSHNHVVKISGRYFLDSNFDIEIFKKNNNKIVFKHPIKNEWQDWWGYNMVDLRQQQNNNILYQYCSVLFGFSSLQFDYMLGTIKKIKDTLVDPVNYHYDLETLSYFFTRDSQDIIHANWIVYGFHGPDGRFVRY